jgi:sirohydrochlorin ferrochelatase
MMRLRSRSGRCSAALLGLVVLHLQTPCARGFTATRLPVVMVMSRRPSSALPLAAADDLFDPLLSPHAYPDGTDAGPKPVNRPDVPWLQQEGGRRSKRSFGIALPTDDEETADDLTTIPRQPPVSVSADVFDPTLSPHLYRNGTPDVVVGDNTAAATTAKVVVGILLMDHGSKSEVANERLVTLAALYQQRQEESSSRSNSSKRIVVRAAHMELAAPSIRDGLAALIEQGVDEIICHPYFLSPGRHVVEDIPHLVQEAMASLNVTIPVVITDPVGSNTDMMMQAIDAVVVAAASKLRVICK